MLQKTTSPLDEKVRILVINTENAMKPLYDLEFPAERYSFMYAQTAQQARRELNCRFDVILIDDYLFNDDGYDLERQVKSSRRNPNNKTPFVVLYAGEKRKCDSEYRETKFEKTLLLTDLHPMIDSLCRKQ
jgi:CheY-like chemotaxis protein